MAQGEKSDYSDKSRHRGLANAKKELQETPWSLQTHRCFFKKKRRKVKKENPYLGGRKEDPCLTCTRDKSSESSKSRGICRGPLAEWVLPSLLGELRESCTSFWPPCVLWAAGYSVARSGLRFGRGRVWRRELVGRGGAAQC